MKKAVTYILLAMLTSIYAIGQEQPSYQQVADKYFFTYRYYKAIPVYTHLTKLKRAAARNYYRLGYCYEATHQYNRAVTAYQDCIKKDSTADSLFMNIGNLLKMQGQYQQAIQAYEAYAAKKDKSAILANRRSGCDSAIQWLQKPANVKLINEENMNTTYADWGAVPVDSAVVFTSEFVRWGAMDQQTRVNKNKYDRTNKPYSKLYAANPAWNNLQDSLWWKQTLIRDLGASVNDRMYHVGAPAFSSQGDTMYFTITSDGGNREVVKEALSKRLSYKIKERKLLLFFTIKNSKGNWQKPVGLPFNNERQYSVGLPALNKNGSTLYFTSDMPGGYGGTDIWFCKKDSAGNWGKPVNCGSTINTEGNELFPVVNDSAGIYFSSDGLAGMGGLDIFKSTGRENKWQQPINIHPPFNSSYDDFYFTTNDSAGGYLSSNRPGGLGSDDIYSFKLPVPFVKAPFIVLTLINTVYAAKDSTLLPGAFVRLLHKDKILYWLKQSDVEGRTDFAVEQNAQYTISAGHENFITDSVQLHTTTYQRSDTVYTVLYLKSRGVSPQPYPVGDKFELKNLYYDFDKYNIRPDAAKVLDELVLLLKQYPSMEIELSSHTDSRGADQYNLVLSQRRAKSAKEYVVSRGIAQNRIIAKGYGETQLTNHCTNGVACTEQEHQLNRRTMVEVIKR